MTGTFCESEIAKNCLEINGSGIASIENVCVVCLEAVSAAEELDEEMV